MPKPLREQVVVLTGASSGIGREAALLLAARGAAVLLAARDAQALADVAAEIEGRGGRALAVATDVAEWPQVERLATEAVGRFGGIDTWVNNAGVAIGGTVEETEIAEIERLVRVNLLGQIFGAKAAIPHMKAQGGGTIINIGLVAGVRAFPVQTTYCATKHGVKGFTDGLRLELQREGDFHVVYIAPTSIDTPLFADARTKFGTQLGPPPPVYDPRIVAESIVFAAEHPRRDIFVGGAAKAFEIMQRISPSFTDWYLTRGDWIVRKQVSDIPDGDPSNLFQPPAHPRTARGNHGREAKATSLYTRVFEWHPALKPLALGLAAAGAAAIVGALWRRSDDGSMRPSSR